jgi:hypothetical protein
VVYGFGLVTIQPGLFLELKLISSFGKSICTIHAGPHIYDTLKSKYDMLFPAMNSFSPLVKRGYAHGVGKQNKTADSAVFYFQHYFHHYIFTG